MIFFGRKWRDDAAGDVNLTRERTVMSEQGEITPDPDSEGEGKENIKGDASPNKETDALRTGMMAEREKRQAAEQESAELRGRLSALEEGASRGTPETTFTRVQLDGAVADGRVTQDEADAIYKAQLKREITEEVTAKVAETTTVNAVGLEIQQYKDALPNLAVRGSDEFAKVAQEFNWMRSKGMPDNLNTELTAMRSVFGPAEKLKADKGTRVLEPHRETGGSAQEAAETKDSWPKDMKPETKRFYEDQIRSGAVVDMAAAKKEWGYKPKHSPRHTR